MNQKSSVSFYILFTVCKRTGTKFRYGYHTTLENAEKHSESLERHNFKTMIEHHTSYDYFLNIPNQRKQN
jgi:hypothetical protein